jgi:hypothetical protein
VKGLVASKDGGSGAARDRFSKDAVAVIVVEDKKVVVAVARRSNKAAGLVSVDLAGGFHEGSEAGLGAKVGRVA